MRFCSTNELQVNHILARDVMADDYNVFLYKNTALTDKYIENLKRLRIPFVYIKDEISEEQIILLKNEVEEMSKAKIKEVIQHHTFNRGNALKEAMDTADNIIANVLEEENVIENIYEIKERSNDIYEHSISTCVLSTLVSLRLGLGEEATRGISVGCLLHDLGLKYLMIDYQDQEIDSLSDKELAEYRKHPVYGYSALKNEKWLSKKSKEIVLCHHERLDGSGYPLHTTEISMETKVVSVCDNFDELICGLGLRRMKIYEAVEYLKSFRGILFDAKVVDVLLEFTAVYPTGSIVMTNEKEIAVVINQNKNFPERPVLRVIKDREGKNIDGIKIIDLVKMNTIFIDTVLD